MNEEQIKQKFKETYPDFMRGDEPLSPYFDIWEYAIEIATNELQEKNDNRLKRHCNTIHSLVDELERRQNAEKELQEELDYAKSNCLFSDCDRVVRLKSQIADIEKENTKLKSQHSEAKKIISEWEDSYCCGADYLYLGNKGKELRIKSQKFLNN